MPEEKFEEAMARLEEIVKGLESGDLALEDALKAFEEGMGLIKFCSKKLEEAEKKVTLLVEDRTGQYSQRPFDIEEEPQGE